MKKPTAILIPLLMAVCISRCAPEQGEEIYLKITLQKGSPPVFRISGNVDFTTPGCVYHIQVLRRDVPKPENFYWDIARPSRRSMLLREVTYGVIPNTFNEYQEARPLEPNVEYCVKVSGDANNVEAFFTYQP